MNVFDLAAKLTLDTSEYESSLNKVSSETEGKAGGGISKGFKVATAAIAAATTAVTAFAGASVKTGAEFDSSMSQVAATMGYTVDELNDSGSEAAQTLQTLRDFAMDMGSKTAFSATQASEALNYMALAGYDAETSMAMLPNVLNLAASGGMELAAASDMVTDAQSALGLSLEETSDMVDMMAAAASKSNTSVSQLGEAILTIGGTAKLMSGGTAELSTALGILADNGIKGAEGGTHLRNVLLSLSAPTDTAAAQLEKLGVNATDASGNMLPLEDIMQQLNSSLEGMGEAEKAQIISTIFNKTDIAAVNALLNTSVDRWEELGAAIEDSEGAAEAMANVQLDNLAGDVTLFQSALEGAKILISDGLTPTLRSFVQFGSEGLTAITDAFKADGLSGAMEAFGTVLADGLNMIIEMLPQLVEAGSQLLGALAEGIIESLPLLIESALAIIQQLASGLAEKLPELIPTVHQIIIQIVETLIDNVDMLIDSAIAIIIALADGLITSLPQLLEKAPEIVAKLVNAIIENAPKLLESALQLIVTLAKGLIQNLPQIVQAAGQIVQTLVQGIGNLMSQIWQIGGDIVRGVWQGIQNAASWFAGQVRGFFQNLIRNAKSALGIASPSKEFAQIGEYLDEGLAKGIEDKEKEPLNRIKELANEIISIVQDMNKKVDAELVKTVNDVAYVANTDYAAAMLKAENIEEFEGLAKQRAAKIAGEGIDLAAKGWASNEDLMKQWSENMAKQTADAVEDVMITGTSRVAKADGTYSDFTWEQPIVTQVVLDGKVVGEAAYKYSKNRLRAVGA